MNIAHRFQHKYTGLQILVWHKNSIEEARSELFGMVSVPNNWIYLDKVTIKTVE